MFLARLLAVDAHPAIYGQESDLAVGLAALLPVLVSTITTRRRALKDYRHPQALVDAILDGLDSVLDRRGEDDLLGVVRALSTYRTGSDFLEVAIGPFARLASPDHARDVISTLVLLVSFGAPLYAVPTLEVMAALMASPDFEAGTFPSDGTLVVAPVLLRVLDNDQTASAVAAAVSGAEGDSGPHERAFDFAVGVLSSTVRLSSAAGGDGDGVGALVSGAEARIEDAVHLPWVPVEGAAEAMADTLACVLQACFSHIRGTAFEDDFFDVSLDRILAPTQVP